jgi:hypothetical protein
MSADKNLQNSSFELGEISFIVVRRKKGGCDNNRVYDRFCPMLAAPFTTLTTDVGDSCGEEEEKKQREQKVVCMAGMLCV